MQRPVQLACQNVIMGLSVFAYDSEIDGLSVSAWATCEAPHVATHEANRALAALMLCDAYATGGTMEIRFRNRVPPALRRYGRTIGLEINEKAESLTPEESRHLFLAVTPMPESLRERIIDYIVDGVESPERLCYALMAQIWSEIELDFLMATSTRTPSILSGGAPHQSRPSRMAETEVCRAARLIDTLFDRLNSLDSAGATGSVRVFEDTTVGVEWEVLSDLGAIAFSGLQQSPLPWQTGNGGLDEPDDGSLIVIPRAHPTDSDVKTALSVAEQTGIRTALLVPEDRRDFVDCPTTVLVCPDRLSELDNAIERKLLSGRIARS